MKGGGISWGGGGAGGGGGGGARSVVASLALGVTLWSAVRRGGGRVDRAGKPVLRDDRELLGLRLAQIRVGRDDGDRGILARAAFGDRRERGGRRRAREA